MEEHSTAARELRSRRRWWREGAGQEQHGGNKTSTLCAPQSPLKLSRLGLLRLGFLGELLLFPFFSTLWSQQAPPSGPVLMVSMAGQALISSVHRRLWGL